MDEMVKEWLTKLLTEEIETETITLGNERIWEKGCDDDYNPHTENIERHEEYIRVLNEIKENYCK